MENSRKYLSILIREYWVKIFKRRSSQNSIDFQVLLRVGNLKLLTCEEASFNYKILSVFFLFNISLLFFIQRGIQPDFYAKGAKSTPQIVRSNSSSTNTTLSGHPCNEPWRNATAREPCKLLKIHEWQPWYTREG